MTRIVLASLATGTPMGQQEYENQLLDHLPAIAPDVDFRPIRIRSLRSTLDGEARLPLRALGGAPQFVQHLAAGYAYRGSALVHRMDLRLPAARREVVTVHDLAPLRFDDEGQLPPKSAQGLHRAEAVICPSHFAAAELQELLDVSGAEVIPYGLDPSLWTPGPDADAVRADIGLTQRFILHSGGATKRKNLRGLAAAWPVIAGEFPDVDLVLCGPPSPARDRLFAGLPRVRMTGRVARSTHLGLMSAAEIVVVPSTYEGFGFPPLEAMARGTAVVAVNRAAVAEVSGEAALLCEPDGESLAAAVATLLADRDQRARLAAAGPAHARRFTWEASARQHAAIYARSLDGGTRMRPGAGKQ